MKLCRAASACLAIVAAGLFALTMVSPAVARPKPPPIIIPPPPPPPMPDVGMGARLVDDAAVYETYASQAGAISPAFTDPQSVADALRVGVAYQPGQLRRGAVAYGAAAALVDATFVDDVRKAGDTPEKRYAIVERIFADPKNVLAFADARGAAALAKAAIARTGLGVFDAGDRVRLAAYSIQHQPWSLSDVADRDGRAAAVKQLSAAFRQPSAAAHTDVDRMIVGEPAQPPMAAPPPYSPLVIRAVALAALAAIGQASDDDVSHLGWLTDDYYLDHCLAETKLSLYECIAVAKPNYEDVFCLGQHGLKDTGACVVKSTWATVPVDVFTKPMTIPSAHIHKAPPRKRRKA